MPPKKSGRSASMKKRHEDAKKAVKSTLAEAAEAEKSGDDDEDYELVSAMHLHAHSCLFSSARSC
jgi:hypothetical protein